MRVNIAIYSNSELWFRTSGEPAEPRVISVMGQLNKSSTSNISKRLQVIGKFKKNHCSISGYTSHFTCQFYCILCVVLCVYFVLCEQFNYELFSHSLVLLSGLSAATECKLISLTLSFHLFASRFLNASWLHTNESQDPQLKQWTFNLQHQWKHFNRLQADHCSGIIKGIRPVNNLIPTIKQVFLQGHLRGPRSNRRWLWPRKTRAGSAWASAYNDSCELPKTGPRIFTNNCRKTIYTDS